jgi:general stress protein 26
MDSPGEEAVLSMKRKPKQGYATPRAHRPAIPGYGISKSKAGMLSWKWAEKKLTTSREYWMMTVRPDGRPHAMIIWGLWADGAFWFGTGSKTQKARNLAANPNCIVGTQDAAEAVILEGVAEVATDAEMLRRLEPISLKKYGMSGSSGSEPVYQVRPTRVFGLIEKSFPKTATRWMFD